MTTVKIGLQEWATEDLKVTKFRNGEDIPLVTDNKEWTELTTAAYCVTPNGQYLYNWYAVNDPRGLAPEGFHVPTDEGWTELENYLGGDEVAGTKMKSSPSNTPPWDGTNSSGFSALPNGARSHDDGHFSGAVYYGIWWSSSAYGSSYAWIRYIDANKDFVVRDGGSLQQGFSVRCLKTI